MLNLEKKNPDRIPVGDRVVIYRRGKKGTWVAEFNDRGIHRRKSLSTCNRKAAIERATRIAAELVDGQFAPRPQVTIETAIDKYLDYLSVEGRARRTIVRYRGELRQFAAFAERKGIRRLTQMSMSLLDAYRAHRSSDHGAASVYHETVVIKQLFRWACRRGMISDNLIRDYEVKKPRRKDRTAPTLEQVNRILDECTSRQRPMIAMLAFTGMRVSSLQHQRRDWIDLDRRRMQYYDAKKRQTVQDVPIHNRLAAELAAAKNDGHTLLFTAAPSAKYPKGGRPISAKRLNTYFTAAARRAGISGFTLHSLRHFFKTFTINSNVPDRVVDAWLHHTDGSVRGGYYHPSWRASRKFMDRVPFDLQDSASNSRDDTKPQASDDQEQGDPQ